MDSFSYSFSSAAFGTQPLVTGAKTAALVPLRNGGIWLPGVVNLDGLHPNTNGYETIKPLVSACVAIRA